MNYNSMKNKIRGLIIIIFLLVTSIAFAFINKSKIVEIIQKQGNIDNKEASRLVDTITASDYGKPINYSTTVNGIKVNKM